MGFKRQDASFERVTATACVLALAAACTATPSADGHRQAGVTGTAGTFGGSTAGTSAVAEGAGMVAAGTGATVPGRATVGATALPCDVRDILKLRCQSCHGAMPVGGPMALVSWEDTQQPSVTDPGVAVHQKIAMRLHDAIDPMPPTGMLGADDLAVLDAWLDNGAIAGTDPTCAPETSVDGGAQDGSTEDLPADAEHCYEIRAHANSAPGDTAAFVSTGERYATFYFDAPWPDGSQGVYFETLYGDHPEILHHWLIYSEENGNKPDGTVEYPATGSHPSSPTLIAGWAPGADNNSLPSDVGLMLSGPSRKMSMEIHFFGPEGTAIPTSPGVRICTVETPVKLRPHTATMSWVGTELGINIPPMAQDNAAVGICTPQYAGDIHVLRTWPHMHLMGRKMESTILRADGSEEDVSPGGGWDFDFNSEVSWKTEYVLRPGDRIRTTCHYTNTSNNSIQVGFENRYEMCFAFTLAYPAKALINKGVIGSTSLTNSATGCLY